MALVKEALPVTRTQSSWNGNCPLVGRKFHWVARPELVDRQSVETGSMNSGLRLTSWKPPAEVPGTGDTARWGAGEIFWEAACSGCCS